MNNIDKHITAGMTGLLAALITTSVILYTAKQNTSTQCYVSFEGKKVVQVYIGSSNDLYDN
jgi:flavoprotein